MLHTAAIVSVGFGTAVAMWAVGYVGRLPAVMLPAPLLVGLMLACLVAGGIAIGRHAGRAPGWPAGAVAGLVTGLLNLLVLGSLLGGDAPNRVVPSALIWLPGSIAVSAALGALGASVGSRAWPATGDGAAEGWTAAMARVAIAATLLLLAVGGLVTSKAAGLAVVDWPNSYGYNMFLYPLSRMTGGIYYEHAHRLFGALVGLTTLALAILLQRLDPRRSVRRIAWIAFGLVVVQGVLGGLRVTGRFTLSTRAEDMAPSLALAVVHGVLAQVVFAALVALGAFTSASWRGAREPRARRGGATDRALGWTLVGLLLVQLVLGAIQRHASQLLLVHVAMAAIIVPLALHVGMRSWGLNPEELLLVRWGLGLAAVTGLQLVLGLAALLVTGPLATGAVPSRVEVAITTAHQWCGAVLLGCAVMVLCWSHRLVADVRR
jgi:cytochrome c oxidase assembly protein subunit 15